MDDDAESRSFLRQIIDINPHFLFVKDREGRFTLVNAAVAEAYGTSPADLVGRTDADFNPNDAEVEHFRQDDLRVMDSLQELRIDNERITDATGRVRSLQTIKRPLVDPDGVARHVLGVSTDITALRDAQRERLELEARVLHAQKLESLGVLAGGIAHDFNNLLVGVMANAELAIARLRDGEPAWDALGAIQRAAHSATDLCQLMLDYSGRRPFRQVPVDLRALVEELLPLLQVGGRSQAEIRMSGDEAQWVAADPAQLRQVVLNLVTNAAEAVADTGGIVQVRTGRRDLRDDELIADRTHGRQPAGPYAFVEVSDQGVGMDAEQVERMFEPFFTTKFSGRGLGLASVQGIVRSHGGVILVRSEPGRGTTVCVYLPVGAPPVDRAVPTRLPAPVEPLAGLTVLVLDDDEVARSTVRDILEWSGMIVITVATGVDALQVLDERPVDLVLLDLTMPGLSGAEVLRRIRERPDGGPPCALMSGYGESDALSRLGAQPWRPGQPAAPDAFLRKPFRIAELHAALRQAFSARS